MLLHHAQGRDADGKISLTFGNHFVWVDFAVKFRFHFSSTMFGHGSRGCSKGASHRHLLRWTA
ncbi:hypothetical protein LMTR13_11510 [Bradyrhizobium icense]|uniref:Uncharacterized protein n=1 Tax=Bradyrhizobium icense TaxID=1274631 RepID=A0A1B1UDF6_9BRAD|nr:hypothetical protein LMTR13_11510 [Bradyrhizobium icense]